VCTTPVGSDPDGPAFQEEWEYAYIVDMLMYLAANTRPDIVYAVHQAARHTHALRASHYVAINIIVRYLKVTRTKGIYFKPDD
jgi:phage-related protein